MLDHVGGTGISFIAAELAIFLAIFLGFAFVAWRRLEALLHQTTHQNEKSLQMTNEMQGRAAARDQESRERLEKSSQAVTEANEIRRELLQQIRLQTALLEQIHSELQKLNKE